MLLSDAHPFNFGPRNCVVYYYVLFGVWGIIHYSVVYILFGVEVLHKMLHTWNLFMMKNMVMVISVSMLVIGEKTVLNHNEEPMAIILSNVWQCLHTDQSF